MPNNPIPVAAAKGMMIAYVNYMKSLGVSMDSQTHSVSFDPTTLQQWLDNVMPYSDELRICMSDYPQGHQHAGRTTVVLWPYKNGQPAKYPQATEGEGDGEEIEPFNEGTLNP